MARSGRSTKGGWLLPRARGKRARRRGTAGRKGDIRAPLRLVNPPFVKILILIKPARGQHPGAMLAGISEILRTDRAPSDRDLRSDSTRARQKVIPPRELEREVTKLTGWRVAAITRKNIRSLLPFRFLDRRETRPPFPRRAPFPAGPTLNVSCVIPPGFFATAASRIGSAFYVGRNASRGDKKCVKKCSK